MLLAEVMEIIFLARFAVILNWVFILQTQTDFRFQTKQGWKSVRKYRITCTLHRLLGRFFFFWWVFVDKLHFCWLID